jgi:hypothetical protein
VCKKIQNSKFLLIAISFFFVNGIIFILDNKLGYFNLLHSAMLQSVESSYDNKSEYMDSTESIAVLITNKLFEKGFNSKTPLDKDKIAYFIEEIIKQSPKSIIFDLDISPDYNFGAKEQQSKTKLYELLKNNSSNVDIVLPFAFFSQTIENQNLKYNWVKEMCNANIKFAFPLLTNEIGSVSQYFEDPYHVSLILNNQIRKEDLCDYTKNNKYQIEDIINIFKVQSKSYTKKPINYQKINSSTINIDSFEDINKYNFNNKVIFLGGSYGFGDSYLTPYGDKYGVEILNAIYYSLNHSIEKSNVYLTLIIYDIIMGFSFGYILNLLLNSRENIESKKMLFYNNLKLISLIVFFYFMSLYISGYLFHNLYMWMNPVPLLIGMFLDGILRLGEKKIVEENSYSDYECLDIVKSMLKIKTIFVLIGIFSLLSSL